MIEIFDFIGKPIRNLQIMLREIAFYYGLVPKVIPDGIYGENTKRAVEVFQERYNLKVTGETDIVTFEEIVKVYDFVMEEKKKKEQEIYK